MAPKANGDMSDWARAPPSSSFGERFLKAIYNPEDKSFLGRTPKRWGIAFLFYAVFYAVLAALFAICMGALLLVMDDHRPMYTMESSLIGVNPGVAYRPIPIDGFVVQLDRANSTISDMYVKQMTEFFQQYKEEPWIADKKECVEEDSFGYPDTPCFFIKLNKIFDWEPQVYDAASLPEDMPEDLATHILSLEPNLQKQIWVSCAEEKNANLTKLVYPWTRGLLSTFYPYTNVMGYRSPLIALKITDVPVNQMISIRCRAWAKNIIYNKSMKEASGYTLIQLEVTDGGKQA